MNEHGRVEPGQVELFVVLVVAQTRVQLQMTGVTIEPVRSIVVAGAIVRYGAAWRHGMASASIAARVKRTHVRCVLTVNSAIARFAHTLVVKVGQIDARRAVHARRGLTRQHRLVGVVTSVQVLVKHQTVRTVHDRVRAVR